MGMHIVITGDPVSGLSFYGPYATEEEAQEAADKFAADEWWTAPLEAFNA